MTSEFNLTETTTLVSLQNYNMT